MDSFLIGYSSTINNSHVEKICCHTICNLLLRHVNTFKIIWQMVNVPKQLNQDTDIAR